MIKERRSKAPPRFTSKQKWAIALGVVWGLNIFMTNASMATGKFWTDNPYDQKPVAVAPPAPVPPPPDPSDTESTVMVLPGSVMDLLLDLKVSEDAGPKYDRGAFGQAWKDTDKNGCDNRNDVLRRDLRKRQTKPGTNGCVLAKGVLRDAAYGPDNIKFVRGNGAIEIDHLVALAEAWGSGAHAWTNAERNAFANDFMNLEAVDSATNQAKSSMDPNGWLPSEVSERCAFLVRYVTVKTDYQLTVDRNELLHVVKVLQEDNCADEKPVNAKQFAAPKPKPMGEPKPKPTPKPEPPKPEPAPEKTDPMFGTCKEANDNGYGPYRRGEVEYGWYRDRDGDGVVCES